MPDYDCLLTWLENVDRTDHITDEAVDCVCPYLVRSIGLTVATHGERYGSKTSLCDGRELVTPRVPRLRPTVAKHDKGSLPHLDVVISRCRSLQGDRD